ncbi:MAG: Ig-like domain-containing protein [Myxococcaceae bacterium]|nr:Ig-like domain-containing protein [Myxococcaceae bacterium]
MRRVPYFITFIAWGALFTSCEVSSRFDCSSQPCPSGQRCSAQYKLCVAEEGPVVTVTSPLAMAVVPGNALKVAGTVKDASEGAVTLVISGEGANVEPVTIDADGHFEVELPLGPMDYAPFTVTLKATDATGISSSTEVAVHVDNVKPRCALLNPTDAGFLNGRGDAVFRIQFDDGSPSLSQQQLAVDGSPLTATLANGVVTAEWGAAPVENGVAHTMRYLLADAAGNACEGQGSFLLDNVPPVLTVSQPMPNALLNNAWFTNTPWVSGPAATDESNPAPTVTVNWGDGAGAKPTTAVDGGYRFVVSKVDEDFQVHPVTVTATDWAGNTTEVAVPVTVDTVAPRITFLSPDAGARFNAASFQGTNEVTVTVDVQDGDDVVSASVSVGGAAFSPVIGSSLKVPTSATDNPKLYPVKLHAVDQAGNESEQTLEFSVDRVAPTVVSTTPANNTRNFDYEQGVSVQFSEAMAVSSPAVAGLTTGSSWTSGDTKWTWSPAADTVYDFTVAPITDAYGNALVTQPSFRFITAPARPAAGLLLNDVSDFEVSTDPDGAISLFTVSTGPNKTYTWGRFNTKTAQFEVLSTITFVPILMISLERWALFSWRNVLPDLTAERIVGLTTKSNLSASAFESTWNINGMSETRASATGLVPIPPMANEPAGSGRVGYLNGSSYERSGRQPIALGVSPNFVAYTDNRFEAIEVNPPNAKLQIYECHKTSQGDTVCDLHAVETLATDINTDHAFRAVSTSSCSVYSYRTAAGQQDQFIFRGVCDNSPFCVVRYKENPVYSTRYAPTSVNDQLVRTIGLSNTFFVQTRTCYGASSWTQVGNSFFENGIHSYRPVASGPKYGALYLTQFSQLKLYWAN